MNEWWEDDFADISNCTADNLHKTDKKTQVFQCTYSLKVPEQQYNRKYTEQEKQWLRPIAETVAMLDGNAFFSSNLSNGQEWYEQYLPEAAAIFYGNGGSTGWAGETSWMKDLEHETESVKDAYDLWKTLKTLSK